MRILKSKTFMIALLGSFSLAGAAHATGGKAYTWIPKIYDYGASAAEDWALVGADQTSDAYKGDAAPSDEWPLLCIIEEKVDEPDNYRRVIGAGFKAFYHGWSGEQIGLTKPVRVSDIHDVDEGHEACRDHFGANARWAEHHDNKVGGWNLGGMVHERSMDYGRLNDLCGLRVLVWIKNQPANPWNY